MISFRKLGNYGRLGNQFFQYVFLRSQAKKLNTKFYCPEWIGDKFFKLNDKDERTDKFNPDYYYVDDVQGFSIEATKIKDGTDIAGFFQTDKYFKREDVRRWFSFDQAFFAEVNKKYSSI